MGVFHIRSLALLLLTHSIVALTLNILIMDISLNHSIGIKCFNMIGWGVRAQYYDESLQVRLRLYDIVTVER